MAPYPWFARLYGDKWLRHGWSGVPTKVRLKNKTWMTFGNGDGPLLSVRGTKKEWVPISTQGDHTGVLFGNCSEFESGMPLANKTVQIGFYYTQQLTVKTDANGDYRIEGIPLGTWMIYAYRLFPTVFINSINPVTFTHDDPVQMLNFFFPPGVWTNSYTFGISSVPASTHSAAQRFMYDVGWQAIHTKRYESWTYYGGQHTYEQPDVYDTDTSTSLYASTLSQTGWIGDEAVTETRDYSEAVSWYSVPVGMVQEAEEVSNIIDQINARGGHYESWTLTAVLDHINVIAHIHGWSVEKNKKSSMPSWYWPTTTINPTYGGVGAVRFQGTTPTAEYDEQGNQISTLGNILYDNGRGYKAYYDIPTVRDHGWGREDGAIVWTGNLKDLGSFGGEHGTPIRDTIISQTIDPWEITDYNFALQYHAQVSPLPPPREISFDLENENYAIDNELGVWFEVQFVYTYI